MNKHYSLTFIMKPYTDNLEHLLDELSRINLLIRSYLEEVMENFPEAGDELRGLYISEAEIELEVCIKFGQ